MINVSVHGHRRPGLAALVLLMPWILLAGGQALAQDHDQAAAQATVPATAPASGSSFALGAGDTVRVTVFDRPELSGDAMIGPDGIASWPMIGDIPAAGHGLPEVRAAISAAVGQVLDHAPDVGVQVVGYRPVYVVGAVAHAGEHAFIPGLSVLQGFAKAGGSPTLAGALAGRSSDQTAALLTARERLLRAVAQERDQLIRRARLQAALNGEETLTLPPGVPTAVAAGEGAVDPVRRWSDVLVAELPQLAVARETHERQDALLEDEIAALSNEGEAISTQLDVVSREVRRMQTLRNQGLTTNDRMMSLRQIEAGLQADRYRRDASLSRARQGQLRAAQTLQEDEAEWRQSRLEELAELEADLVQTRIEIRGARERLTVLGATDDFATDGEEQSDPGAMPSFVVMRRSQSGAMETMVAQPNDLMQPGDVLRVDPPLSGQQTAAMRIQ